MISAISPSGIPSTPRRIRLLKNLVRASAALCAAESRCRIGAQLLLDWEGDNREGKDSRQIPRRDRGAANEVVAFVTKAADAIKTIRSQDELQLVQRPRLRTQSRAYGRQCVPAYFPAIWRHETAAELNRGPHLSIATGAG